jgi:hypothetical protein
MSNKSSLRLIGGQAGEERPEQYRVLLSAMLVTTTTERPVKIRNLATTSAQIEGLNLPAQGTDVILKRGTLEIFATMAWSEGRRGALHFETALSSDEMLAQIHPARTPPPTVDAEDYRRPGFQNAPLSEEDRKTVANWATPAGRLAYRD